MKDMKKGEEILLAAPWGCRCAIWLGLSKVMSLNVNMLGEWGWVGKVKNRKIEFTLKDMKKGEKNISTKPLARYLLED